MSSQTPSVTNIQIISNSFLLSFRFNARYLNVSKNNKKKQKNSPIIESATEFRCKTSGWKIPSHFGWECLLYNDTNKPSLSLSLVAIARHHKKAKQNGQRNQIERRCMVRECRLYGLTDTVEFSRIHTRCNNMRCTTREAPCVLGSALLRVN